MSARFTSGPWTVCQHLKGVEEDLACSCGYRGVIFGPDTEVPMAICQPGHDPEPAGQEFTAPQRYNRETEIANAHLIAAAPELYCELESLVTEIDSEIEQRKHGGNAEDWEYLQRKSDRAHAALSKARGEQS